MCGSLFSPGTATSTYRPDPAASANINSLLSRINSVSQQPYQQYGGQLVAPLNATQQSGIQHINDNYGVGQPYLNAASNYANAGAAPVGNLSSADISKYYSPYQQQVIDATMANINQTNAQQQNQVRGNAATAGALGGDRLAVAQSELARNQALAGNQTLAGLQSQGYQSAIQTALSQQQNQQANANRQAQAAYAFGNLGSTAQNLGLQGASAQLQGGGVEQGNYQALLNSLYGQFQQQQAFPYQQLGWAGGLAGPLGGALGGTQTQQRASPSPFQVATGLGSLFGSFLRDGGRVYADGGRVPNFIADVGGYVPAMSPVQIPRPPISTSMGEPEGNPFGLSSSQTKAIRNLGDDAGRMFGFSGMGGGNYSGSPESNSNLRPIGSPEGYAHGGLVHAVHAIRKSLRGYDDGGVVDPSDAERAYGMDLLRNGMAPAPRSPFRGDRLTEDIRNASGFEVVDPDTGATTASAGFAPMAPRPDLPPEITGEPAGGLPPGARAYAPTGAPQSPYGSPMTPQGQRFLDLVRNQDQQAPPPPPPRDYNGPFADAAKLFGLNGGLSPEDRRSLRATGFGILAAPGGVSGWEALGQGGLKGLAEAQEARKEAEVSKQHETSAKFQRMNLERAAAQLAETATQHARTFDETVRQHRVPPGFRPTEAGALEPVPGGPHDPEVIKAATAAKQPVGAVMDDETARAIASRYVTSGNRMELSNLGSGTIGAMNRAKVNTYTRHLMEERGISDEEFANKQAEWESRKSAQRVLGTQEAKMGTAAFEAKGAIKLARGIIENVPRTSFLPFNKLLEGFQKATLSPEQAELYARTQGIVNTYAAVMARGSNVTTDSSRHRAEDLLNTAADPTVYNRVLNTIESEIDMAINSPEKMREFYRKQYGAKSIEASPPATGTPTKPDEPKVGTRKQFKQGWGVWDGSKWVPE